MAFSSFIYTGIQCSISECHPSSWEEWWGETASAKPHWQHHLHGVHVHNSGTVWKGQTHLHLTSHIPGTGIYLECWEYRGFPTPWGWFPLPRISKVYIENSNKVLAGTCLISPSWRTTNSNDNPILIPEVWSTCMCIYSAEYTRCACVCMFYLALERICVHVHVFLCMACTYYFLFIY